MTSKNPSDIPEPGHHHPQTREALGDALLDLVATARHDLVLCATALDPALFNSTALHDALARLLTRHPRNRVRLVVEDTEHMLTHCARLVGLARRLSDLLTIHRLGERHHGLNMMFAVADSESCLVQQDLGVIDATLDLHAPRLAAPLVERFDDIWAASEPVPGLHGFRL